VDELSSSGLPLDSPSEFANNDFANPFELLQTLIALSEDELLQFGIISRNVQRPTDNPVNFVI